MTSIKATSTHDRQGFYPHRKKTGFKEVTQIFIIK